MEKCVVVNKFGIVVILGVGCRERIYTTCTEFCFILLIFLDHVCVLSFGRKSLNNLEPLKLLELSVYGVTIMGSHSTDFPQFSYLFYDRSWTNRKKKTLQILLPLFLEGQNSHPVYSLFSPLLLPLTDTQRSLPLAKRLSSLTFYPSFPSVLSVYILRKREARGERRPLSSLYPGMEFCSTSHCFLFLRWHHPKVLKKGLCYKTSCCRVLAHKLPSPLHAKRMSNLLGI